MERSTVHVWTVESLGGEARRRRGAAGGEGPEDPTGAVKGAWKGRTGAYMI